RLELRNVVANYPFEKPHRFPGARPNFSHRDYLRLSCVSQTARDPDPALWRLRLVSDGRIIEVTFGASSRPQSVIAAGPFARTEGRFLAGATTKMAGGSAFWMKGLAAVLACESVASANLRMSGNPDCARDTPVCLATDRRNSGGRPLVLHVQAQTCA